jgi:transglutaminase-like putative cysteine protease
MSLRMTGQVRITFMAALATWLAAWCLGPLVDNKQFVLTSIPLIALIAAIGATLRALRTPWPVIPLVQVLVVAELTVVFYAHPQAGWGVLPNADAVTRLSDLFSRGVDISNRYGPPVPTTHGISLLLTISIAAVAICVDVLAVSLGRAPLAGLPLLAFYTVPVATVEQGVSAFVFIPGAAGFLALLAADEREHVSRWGKQIARSGHLWNDRDRDRVDTNSLAQAGRRVGFAAVALAVVVPVLLPSLPSRLIHHSSGLGNGEGPLAITNPILDLRRDLVRPADVAEVVVRTDDPDPSYLRLTALDEFNGSTWAPSQRDFPLANAVQGGMPPPTGQGPDVRTKQLAYSLQVSENFQSSWLPAPYPTTSISVVGDWRYDVDNLDVVSANPDMTTAGLKYSLLAEQVRPTTAQLEAAGQAPTVIREKYTAVPPGLPPVIASTAEDVTLEATTNFEKAVALQDWFRNPINGFRYSTRHVAGNGLDTIVSFLTNNRSGYCEQYAASMALMARTLGIPARVAVGFLSPQLVQGSSNTYVYSSHDLHAWPELYFSGVGWTRFEPTPRAGTTTPSYTNGVSTNPGGNPSTGPTSTPSNPEKVNKATPSPGSSSANRGPGGVAGSAPWVWITTALILLLILLGPWVARRAIRTRRWATATSAQAAAEAAWDDVRDYARDYAVTWPTTLTPRGTGRSLLSALGHDSRAAASVRPLVSLVERARYARSVETDDQVRQHVETLATVMRDKAPRRRRLLALLWPPSLLASASREWERIRSDLGADRVVGIDTEPTDQPVITPT